MKKQTKKHVVKNIKSKGVPSAVQDKAAVAEVTLATVGIPNNHLPQGDKLEAVAKESLLSNPKPRDSRIPPVGSVIRKTYHGSLIEVEVLENGFSYQGKVYKSISRVAMDIVKRPVSGYVFFGLTK